MPPDILARNVNEVTTAMSGVPLGVEQLPGAPIAAPQVSEPRSRG